MTNPSIGPSYDEVMASPANLALERAFADAAQIAPDIVKRYGDEVRASLAAMQTTQGGKLYPQQVPAVLTYIVGAHTKDEQQTAAKAALKDYGFEDPREGVTLHEDYQANLQAAHVSDRAAHDFFQRIAADRGKPVEEVRKQWQEKAAAYDGTGPKRILKSGGRIVQEGLGK